MDPLSILDAGISITALVILLLQFPEPPEPSGPPDRPETVEELTHKSK